MAPLNLGGILLTALLLLAVPARAQEGACREDARRLCPKAQTGHQRLHCLDADSAAISATCREELARMRASGEKFRQDCREDSAKLCPGLGGRKLMSCLEAGLARLSQACAGHVEKIRGERRVAKERIPAACRPDAEKLCRQVTAGEGRIQRCLKENEAKLQKDCRQNLARSPASVPQ